MIKDLSKPVLAFLWASLVLIWPLSTGVESMPQPPHEDVQAAHPAPINPGESLYRSNLTQANFGMLGFHFVETNANRKNWSILSEFAELNRKENYFYLTQVEADFYGAERGNVLHTTSQYGRSHLDRNVTELEGDVVIVSDDGYVFKMQRVDYDGQARIFSTNSQVTMQGGQGVRPSLFLEGEGMRGSPDTEHFVLKKNVWARRKMSNAQWLKIQSKTGEFYTNTEKALFHENVRAEMPRVIIKSDNFELETANAKETLVALGNVTLYNRNRKGQAKKATLLLSEEQILLEGNAEIQTEKDTMKGEHILIYTEDDRVEVKRAEGLIER